MGTNELGCITTDLCRQIREGKDEITRLREEIERLREALKPFAERADRWDGQPERQILVMLSECRAAAAAIREHR